MIRSIFTLVDFILDEPFQLPSIHLKPQKCKHVHGSILITDDGIYKECRKCGELF